MNRQVADKLLTRYVELVHEAARAPMWTKERKAAREAANEFLPIVNKLLRSLAPDMETIEAYTVGSHVAALPMLDRARDLLEAWEEIDRHEWTGGGAAFPLSLLDPVISEVAVPLWKTTKFRQAVNDAATSLNKFAQEQIGRNDISDKALMGEVFSDKSPEQGKSRLRCPGDQGSETVRSQQEGARAYAIGAFQAIRNPAHHLPGDWNPVTAFHHLASLSQVAQWFRDWDIAEWVPPPPDYGALRAIAEGNYQARLRSSSTSAELIAKPDHNAN